MLTITLTILRWFLRLSLAVLLVGCQRSGSAPQPGATATAPADDWAEVQATGRIIVGTSADYAPFSFYTPNFTLDGFDVALVRELGRRLGVEVEIRDFAFEGLLDALQLQQIDIAIAAISLTPEREQRTDFTQVYYIGQDGVLARQGANTGPIRVAQDLASKRIAVQYGSVYESWVNKELVATGLLAPDLLQIYGDMRRAVDELRAGNVDLVLLDYAPAEIFVRQGGVEIVGGGLAPQSFAIAVRKGSTLRRPLNDGLAALQNEGYIAQLGERYLALQPAEDVATSTPPPTSAPTATTPAPTATTPPVAPTATPIPPTPAPCLDGMAFEGHLNYDEQGMSSPPVLQPGQPFTKAWRLRNSGSCPWQPTYMLVYVGGNNSGAQMGGQTTAVGMTVPAGGQFDMRVNLIAPVQPGVYQGFWQLVNAQGAPFGQRIPVGIQVPGPPTPTPTPPMPDPAIFFAADRTQVMAGNPVVLTWNVTNARAVYLYAQGQPWEANGVSSQGSRQVWPQVTTIYELRVTRLNGTTDIRQIRIDVLQPPTPTSQPPEPAIFFAADRTTIVAGNPVVFTWNVTNARALYFYMQGQPWEANAVPSQGSRQVWPQATTVYELRVIRFNGATDFRQILIEVLPPPTPTSPPVAPVIQYFAANPEQISLGACTSLRWEFAGLVTSARLYRNGELLMDNIVQRQYNDCPNSGGVLEYRLEASNGRITRAAAATVLVLSSQPR
jgi:polar amino acid transport system substrate-binding protein